MRNNACVSAIRVQLRGVIGLCNNSEIVKVRYKRKHLLGGCATEDHCADLTQPGQR